MQQSEHVARAFDDAAEQVAAARADTIARAFHEAYEQLAPEHGYRTREASAKPWEDVPDANKRLMVATVRRLLDEGTIHA